MSTRTILEAYLKAEARIKDTIRYDSRHDRLVNQSRVFLSALIRRIGNAP